MYGARSYLYYLHWFRPLLSQVSDVCMAIYSLSQCIWTPHHLFNNLFQLTVRFSNALRTPSHIFHCHMLRSFLLHTVPSEISCAYGTKPAMGNEIHIFRRGWATLPWDVMISLTNLRLEFPSPLSIRRSLNTPLGFLLSNLPLHWQHHIRETGGVRIMSDHVW